MQKIKDRLEKIVNFYRIAPFGETGTLISIGLISKTYDDPVALIANGALILCGTILTKLQFRTKNRIEDMLQKGFNEWNLRPTIHTWCNRQTTRTVTRKYGFLDDYDALCKRERAYIEFPNLPHF